MKGALSSGKRISFSPRNPREGTEPSCTGNQLETRPGRASALTSWAHHGQGREGKSESQSAADLAPRRAEGKPGQIETHDLPRPPPAPACHARASRPPPASSCLAHTCATLQPTCRPQTPLPPKYALSPSERIYLSCGRVPKCFETLVFRIPNRYNFHNGDCLSLLASSLPSLRSYESPTNHHHQRHLTSANTTATLFPPKSSERDASGCGR